MFSWRRGDCESQKEENRSEERKGEETIRFPTRSPFHCVLFLLTDGFVLHKPTASPTVGFSPTIFSFYYSRWESSHRISHDESGFCTAKTPLQDSTFTRHPSTSVPSSPSTPRHSGMDYHQSSSVASSESTASTVAAAAAAAAAASLNQHHHPHLYCDDGLLSRSLTDMVSSGGYDSSSSSLSAAASMCYPTPDAYYYHAPPPPPPPQAQQGFSSTDAWLQMQMQPTYHNFGSTVVSTNSPLPSHLLSYGGQPAFGE